MKRAFILGLILLFTACEKDYSPTKPTISTEGTIQIIIADKSVPEESVPDSLDTVKKPAKPASLDQLEVRVLKSDNSVLASEIFTPSNGDFQVSMTVEANNDLKVLCLGSINGVVEYFGIDDDVDVEAGKTTTAVINGWTEPYLSQIAPISPNPSTDGNYTVSWTKAPNATIYVLEEADNYQFAGVTNVYSGSNLKWSASGKASGRYYYQVRASNTYNVISSWSDSASVVVHKTYTISGTVSDADGVTITLSGDDSDSQTVDDGGSYSFTIAEGGNYTITPTKSGYKFIPASQTFNNVTSNQTQNFTAMVITYTISGTVSDADGVTITLSGDDSDSQTVDDGSSYSFTIAEGGNYTITPTKSGYTFTPASQTFNNVTSNQTQNFTAMVITYIISGTVSGADGVTVDLSGDATGSLVVNDGGSYSFTVAEGGNYIVTPSKSGFFFSPSVKNFDNVTADQTQNFAANVITYTISGTVSGADGVTVSLSGDKEQSLVVDDGGKYSFIVDFGGDYTVTPSRAGYTFTPSNQTFNNVTSNQTQNFTAIKVSKIAFVSYRDGNYEIYVMDADGSNQTNLTYNSAFEGFPSWSPDGSRIAFTSDRDGNYEIYLMDADGSNQTNLTDNPAYDDFPSWTPDGSRIAFTSHRDGNYEIYVMDADGSNQTRLTNNSASNYKPSWSPDGSQIAFYSDTDGNFEIYVMDADGSNQTRLTDNSAWDWFPSWSPDGSRISFTSDRDGNWEIYIMNADGSNQTRLTDNSAGNMQPSWSPDGSKIAFASYRDGNAEIYVMDADGSNQRNITNNPAGDYAPSWSPY